LTAPSQPSAARDHQRTRPPDLIYGLDDRPPLPHLLLLGLQHVAVTCPYLVFVTLIAQAAGASIQTGSSLVSLGMIGIAVATLLQVWPLGPIGSGYLIPPVVSAIYFAPAIDAARHGGLGAVCAMTIVAGLFEAGFASVLPRLRKIFPPVVSGFIVMAVGAELGLIGVQGFLGVKDIHDPQLASHLFVAGSTLAIMVGFGIWGRGLPRLVCGLIGLTCGVILAYFFGLVSHRQAAIVATVPLMGLPSLDFLEYKFDLRFLVPFLIAGLASGLRTIGVVTTAQQINDASWRRPDLANIRAGVLADGLAAAIGGLLGTSGLSASPSLVGIEKVTGATSRYIAYAIVGWLLLLACMPKLGAMLQALPLPVIGAALVFNGSSMLVGGIQIITSRPVTMRTTFIVGISFLFAISRAAYPEFYHALPAWTGSFTDSILSIAVVVCVSLNIIFMIGEKRSQSMVVEASGEQRTATIDDFLRKQGKQWSIGQADIERAITSVNEVVHILDSGGLADASVRAKISYDDLDLVVVLSYRGALPNLAFEHKLQTGMVEEQIFAAGLAGFLSAVYPDRLDYSRNDRNCEITLYFQT
jgi:xanthine permease XanP